MATIRKYIPLCMIAFVGAILSIALQGFIVGVGNNVYHLPIIAGLYDEPQFAHDAFIQSLRYYTSFFWLAAKFLVREDQIDAAFLGFQILSRFLAFLGFLLCASLLGVTSNRMRATFAALLAITSLMRGSSVAGAAGLFINIFTHSEFANGLTLICIFFIVRNNFIMGVVVNGIIFGVNAFMAVWNALPIAAVVTWLVIRRKLTQQDVVRLGIGVILSCIIAAPTVFWILGIPDFGHKPDFDYTEYLRAYFPDHFLFDEISLGRKIYLFIIVSTGFLAFLWLRPDKRWFLVFFGFVAVYVIGIFLPYITHSKTLLNLALLRSSGDLHIFTALAILTLTTRWLHSDDRREAYLFGPLLMVACCTSKYALVGAIPVMIAAWVVHLSLSAPALRAMRQVCVGITIVATGLTAWNVYAYLHTVEAQIQAWQEMGAWIRKETADDSVFLLLPKNGWEYKDESGAVSFEMVSRRRSWLEDGAPVMWLTSYYDEWHKRLQETKTLKSFADRIAYAASHQIQYLITDCKDADETKIAPVHRNNLLCLYAMPSGTDQ